MPGKQNCTNKEKKGSYWNSAGLCMVTRIKWHSSYPGRKEQHMSPAQLTSMAQVKFTFFPGTLFSLCFSRCTSSTICFTICFPGTLFSLFVSLFFFQVHFFHYLFSLLFFQVHFFHTFFSLCVSIFFWVHFFHTFISLFFSRYTVFSDFKIVKKVYPYQENAFFLLVLTVFLVRVHFFYYFFIQILISKQ